MQHSPSSLNVAPSPALPACLPARQFPGCKRCTCNYMHTLAKWQRIFLGVGSHLTPIYKRVYERTAKGNPARTHIVIGRSQRDRLNRVCCSHSRIDQKVGTSCLERQSHIEKQFCEVVDGSAGGHRVKRGRQPRIRDRPHPFDLGWIPNGLRLPHRLPTRRRTAPTFSARRGGSTILEQREREPLLPTPLPPSPPASKRTQFVSKASEQWLKHRIDYRSRNLQSALGTGVAI